MRTFMKDEVGFMEMETYEAIFNQFTPMAIKLNWRGESLLHPNIIRMIKYAKLKGVLDVALNTNGLLLDKEMVKHLLQAGLDRLIISVDGATPNSYENIRQGGNFEKLIKNIIHMNLLYMDEPNKPKITI